MQQPASVTTFLFTDIEGSTRLWERQPDRMQAALARHDALAREAVESTRGRVVKTTGDDIHAVLNTTQNAIGNKLTARAAKSATATISAMRSTAPRGS